MLKNKRDTSEYQARKAELAARAERQRSRASEIHPDFVAAFAGHMHGIRARNGVGRPPKNKPVRESAAL